jgi:hypothetical protein
MMITPARESNPEALGTRWTRTTELLGREAQRLSERRLTRLQRRRAVRRIQVLERIARRAMTDYRLALERQLGTSILRCRPAAQGEHRVQ